MTTTNTAAKKFAWNVDNLNTAASMYAELLGGTYNPESKSIDLPSQPGQDVHAAANSEKALNEIALAVGAKSGRAVRGKLAKEGVYVTLEAAPAPSTSTRISKGQYVRSMARGLGVDIEALQTLDKANLEALEVLTSKVSALLVASGSPAIEVK